MAVKFPEDIIPLRDLKTNPGWVLRQVADSRRPVLLTSRGALSTGGLPLALRRTPASGRSRD